MNPTVLLQTGPGDAARTPLRVTIPSPAGSVRIRTADKEGKPVPGRFAVRVNGEMIPFSIGSRMARVWGYTGPGGETRWSGMPAAVFEFWPAAGSDPDLTRPPVRVGFSGGDEVVQLTIP